MPYSAPPSASIPHWGLRAQIGWFRRRRITAPRTIRFRPSWAAGKTRTCRSRSRPWRKQEYEIFWTTNSMCSSMHACCIPWLDGIRLSVRSVAPCPVPQEQKTRHCESLVVPSPLKYDRYNTWIQCECGGGMSRLNLYTRWKKPKYCSPRMRRKVP